MTEPAGSAAPETPAATPEAPAVAETPETPPWGDEFDPARAWKTIQTLREKEKEANTLRGRVAELEPLAAQGRELADAAAAHEEAQKSELQKAQEAMQRTQQERDSFATDATRYRVALEHGITDPGDLTMLGTGTEDELKARAEWIKQKNDAAAASVAPQLTPPPTARNQQVFPGATPPVVPAVADDAYPASWLSPTQAARIAGASTTP